MKIEVDLEQHTARTKRIRELEAEVENKQHVLAEFEYENKRLEAEVERLQSEARVFRPLRAKLGVALEAATMENQRLRDALDDIATVTIDINEGYTLEDVKIVARKALEQATSQPPPDPS